MTNRRLTAAIGEQLPQVGAEQILSEPCKRDTAPCIGLAAVEVVRHDPDAVMAVMPADHVIRPEPALAKVIEFAARLVAEDPERMVTFGILPTYAAQSFGYIERGRRLPRRPPPSRRFIESLSFARSRRPTLPSSIWTVAIATGTRGSLSGGPGPFSTR